MEKIVNTDRIKNMMDKNGHISGDLDLSGTQITALPDGLTVGGDLYLRGTQITALPDGLTVGGDLYLSGTQITALPDGLTVGGGLYLSGTQWSQVDFAIIQKFAAPWFTETLLVDAIHGATGWCEAGIREAMGAIGMEHDDDAESYDRAEVHAALRRASGAIGDNDRASIALAILDRVEAGR